MSLNRLETLERMVAADPSNSFLRYGLAMEYRNQGRLDDAVAEFHALVETDPDYTATYLHAGQTLERMNRVEEARAMYERGVAATTRSGERHALSELQTALSLMG